MTSRPYFRIAMMLESDGPGGAEMMVFRLSQALRERGHTIVPVNRADGNGWLGGLFRGVGVSPEFFRIRRAIDPQGVRGLTEVFRRNRVDVVHSHEFTMAVYGSAASRLLGLPHLITMHGGFTACAVLRRRIALRWAIRNSEQTVMVSEATRRQFATELGLPEKRLTVVPNGVLSCTGQAAKIREEFNIRPGECTLLAVGTLERHKGHSILIEALARLVRAGLSNPWNLIIAGGRGGDQHENLLKSVRDTGLAGRVHIVTNRNDVPDLLEAADIFVMPSLWEGLPMALLEAMLARKAIIASATAGIPEAITDGCEGLLVAPGNAVALTEALKALIADPLRRLSLGAAAESRARREFTAEVMAQRYEELYASAWNARSGKRLTA